MATDQISSAETTVSEMYIANPADEDCETAMSTIQNLHMPRGGTDPENGLRGIAPFLERDPPDYVSSTLEWRGKVLQSQQATLVATRRFRQQQTAKERQGESLENKIREIREDFRKKEERLEKEIVKLKKRHEENMKQLEEEENDGGYFVSESWEVQSDYQPTECGD